MPIFLALAGLLVVSLLLIGGLSNIIVWPVLAAAFALSFIIVSKLPAKLGLPGSRREQAVVGVAVILFVVAWGVANMKHTSQHVYVNRDPGIYTVTAAELLDKSDLELDQEKIFDEASGVTDVSFGFGADATNSESLFAQGAHLFPALIGLTGRIIGKAGMLHLNPVIAAAALLSFYGFARIIVKPRWALLATVAMSLSLPFIYFSRDTYTEPLAMLFTFGGLSTLWLAQVSKKKYLWLLAGVVIGAGTLTRIDAYMTIAAILAFVAVYVAIQRKRKIESQAALSHVVLLVAGMAFTGFIGWLDIATLSSGYYHDLRKHFVLEMTLTGAIFAIMLVAIVVAQKTSLFQKLDKLTAKFRGPALTTLAVLICAFLVSRPLWYVGRGSRIPFVEGVQGLNGAVVDGTRSYAEITFNWNVWYIGILLAILGLLGLVVATHRVSGSKKNAELLGPSLILVFVTMVIYFVRPSITPDQIWASRRMLPVVMPGLALFGVYALNAITEKRRLSKAQTSSLFVVLAIGILYPVLSTSWPFLQTRTNTPLLAQVNDVCSSLPENSVVLWYGRIGDIGTQTAEAFCNTPSLNLTDAHPSNLRTIYKEANGAGYKPVIGVLGQDFAQKQGQDPFVIDDMTMVSSVTYKRIEYTLEKPPSRTTTHGSTILLGKIQQDGSVTGIDR